MEHLGLQDPPIKLRWWLLAWLAGMAMWAGAFAIAAAVFGDSPA